MADCLFTIPRRRPDALGDPSVVSVAHTMYSRRAYDALTMRSRTQIGRMDGGNVGDDQHNPSCRTLLTHCPRMTAPYASVRDPICRIACIMSDVW